MKYLKKVSASQLISNTGTIIDSMNPGDDQTVNAPSIHAVKDYIGDLNSFSNTEKVVGTWFDKPLYRKVIKVQKALSIGNNNIAHQISNLKNLVHIYGFRDTVGYNRIPYIGSNGKVLIVNQVDSANLTVFAEESWVESLWYFVLEYTKTTD